ncbi:MAG: glycosyltransferase [Acidimicrobiales bacterium]
MSRPMTVLFMPESAYGPTNNCIGIGAVLRARGHRVVFASEASWRGRLERFGFEEELVDLAPVADAPTAPDASAGAGAGAGAGQFWTEFVRETAPIFRRPTIEQLEGFVRPTWQALLDGARYVQSQLEAVADRVRPDVVVEDNVCAFPALLTTGAPFVRIVSCNPLELGGDRLPPKFSGYPVDDATQWREFRAEYDRLHRDLWSEYDEWVRESGAPGLLPLEFIHESDTANLYVYPEVADYTDRRPLGDVWHRVESCVRGTEEGLPVELDEFVRRSRGALVYLSLGSLGSADVALMRRLVDTLSRTPHRYVVSMGPLADEYELPDNMWGAPQVPQTSVLPHVDVVITHGGNNTTTECFHFGKPMVVLPLFWDQHDNAQRVADAGAGRRLSTYGHRDEELIAAVDDLLANDALRARMASVGEVIRSLRGVDRAAAIIERAARGSSQT